MKKKSRFIGGGIALLLIALLALSGCPSSTGSTATDGTGDGTGTGNGNGGPGGYTPPDQAVENAKNLVSQLGGSANAGRSGATVTLKNNIIISPSAGHSVLPFSRAGSTTTETLYIDTLTIMDGVIFKVDSELTVTVNSGAQIEVAGGGIVTLVEGDTIGGKIEVVEGATLEVKSRGKVTVENKAVLTIAEADDEAGGILILGGAIETKNGATVEAKGTLEAADGGVITVADDDSVTIGGEISGTIGFDGDGTPDLSEATVEDGTTITLPAGQSMTFEVATLAGLPDAITKAKAVAGGKGVVQLTQDFYGEATSAPLIIDAGETPNEKPYTIKGTDNDTLNVGIVLANDNVTLEGVKIAVTNATLAARTQKSSTFTETRYTAGVAIGRVADATGSDIYLSGPDLASKNVTVTDCEITIDYSNDQNTASVYPFNAGIYICADLASSPPENISIIDNIVTATGRGTNAAQGLSVGLYDPSMVITGNTLTSETGGTQAVNGPAAGLFINAIIPGTSLDTVTPQIEDNTLDGKNVDFYVNINSTGDYKGIPALFNAKFGTSKSPWVTGASATGDFYERLYTLLIDQAKDDGYAGLFFMSLGPPAGAWDGYCFVYEAWAKTSGAVTAVDYWGAGIQAGDEVYDAGSGDTKKDTDAAAGGTATAHGEAAGYRGRITISGNTLTPGQDFHWNLNDAGQDSYPKQPQP
jgi:hypothetical protein